MATSKAARCEAMADTNCTTAMSWSETLTKPLSLNTFRVKCFVPCILSLCVAHQELICGYYPEHFAAQVANAMHLLLNVGNVAGIEGPWLRELLLWRIGQCQIFRVQIAQHQSNQFAQILAADVLFKAAMPNQTITFTWMK